MEIHVQNVVSSSSAGVPLDLQKISMALDEAEYVPEKFPGLIYKVKKPKTALLLFSSGKLVCTGAKSVKMAEEVVGRVLSMIKEMGVDVDTSPKVTVQNIVATTDLGRELNLNSIAITLGLEKVEYEPEQFPGLVYRVAHPRVVALLFGSGKIVCTGAREIKDIGLALDEIVKELSDAGL
ncbi:MAG: TATA-box-binding protein [Candidatus Thermoplasmatota archaeon]|nr:TATA-box-binding protein [Candidatus Thermoplasmatota archaeon]